ncbi:acyl-homoserine-lactone synthase [Sphingosinicella sp. BN140058]|uniref:acyl-homoserine-lactone synthase n=1 Tax=Sphingosinicella sp. BN140058 TaxID=1892855 RepID=UPI0010102027|nr:acyl-homoserine-lactone synthase [Sphingosinicella sp. BN140058]QAY78195.1 GNAT family N-acetyltransferase [Sphingosinicella sp. BN140058]
MIVSTDQARPRDHALLRSMFEARKRVFVDLLKWDVPVLEDRYEVDQFDDPHATYLIVADRHGGHLGSVRLLKTTRPHLLDTLFPSLCAGGVPSSPHMLEITRFCLDPRASARARLVIRNRLVSALVEHALASGIKAYTGVAELAWLQQVLAFGWQCRPLGLPQTISGRLLGALRIDVDEDTPALLARNAMWLIEDIGDDAVLAA